MDERIRKALKIGASGFIKKPFSSQEIIDNLQKVINQ